MSGDTTTHTDLPIPDLYRSENAHRWTYRPDQQTVFERALEWRERHGLALAPTDRIQVRLQLTDVQKDFCFPEGSLFVGGRSGRGALEDNDRTARFIYRNLGVITEITSTMDTHYPYQIFFPSFWLTEDGGPPPPHREITVEQLRSGEVRPNPALASQFAGGDEAWLRAAVEHYCQELEKTGKYTLYLWPPHCLLGSAGHEMVGVLHETRLFHAFARLAPGWMEIKGGHPLTEHYSALSPEVLEAHDGTPIGARSTGFTERLLASDALIVAGQAASHCVKHTLDDLLNEIRQRDESLAGRVYILEDCMSSVAVPDPERPGEYAFDFTPRTEEALRRYAAAGMHVVRSTDPVSEWPDFPL